MRVMKFLGDLYMGPDGETWALGRVYTIPIMVTGLAIPVYAIHKTGQAPSMGDLSVGLLGLAAAVSAMVAVTNHIDTPGGTITHPNGGPTQ